MAKQHSREDWEKKAAALSFETQMFINGQYRDAKEGGRFETINPATGDVITSVSEGKSSDIEDAVAAARKAYRSGVWARKEPRERMRILYHFAELVEAHTEEFALLDTLDTGKPIVPALQGDIPLCASTIQYFAELIDKHEGLVTATRHDALHYVVRQPFGVVGLIVPWNFPLLMAVWKVAPALATGNSIVLKPAEQSPLSALLLARLFMEAGGPAGVLNVVPGFGEHAGKALALHNDVDKVAFTGSAEVGKLMMVYAGQSNMKRVTTECGGKTPQIILKDAPDIDKAVTYAVNGIYENQGEVCSAGSRILVERSIYDEVVNRFEIKTRETISVGHPFDPSTTMGSLITKQHQKRVLDYIEIGKQEGAQLKFGGSEGTGDLAKGAYVEPTLFTNVDGTMRIAQEEIIGPVAGILPIDNLEHGLEVANDTTFGLAASVWTSDVSRAHSFARDVEAGIVWVNCFDHGDATSPWGGFKQSGNGRDKCRETFDQYTQTKSVWVELGD